MLFSPSNWTTVNVSVEIFGMRPRLLNHPATPAVFFVAVAAEIVVKACVFMSTHEAHDMFYQMEQKFLIQAIRPEISISNFFIRILL